MSAENKSQVQFWENLLKANDILLESAFSKNDAKRQNELLLARGLIKDELIRHLNLELGKIGSKSQNSA